jgi:hypothetical protein
MVVYSPDKALIFRVVHFDNLKWIFYRKALEAKNHSLSNDSLVSVGNNDVIRKRAIKEVPIPPKGTLDDYVPFYFTPFSMMLYNIHTGYGETKQIANKDLLFFVTSLHALREKQIPFIYTDRHALMIHANFYSDIKDLDKIDWKLLESRDFSRNVNDPDKNDRYQAEALVHKRVPLAALEALVCYNEETEEKITEMDLDLSEIRLLIRKEWYFS